MKNKASDIQAEYYTVTAEKYDEMHISNKDEHCFALSFMVGMLDFLGVKTILDVGAGTGRAIQYIKEKRPEIRIVGLEPVKALREAAYSKGISRAELIDGDGSDIDYKDGEFDLVCEFGVLHHVKRPERIISEMLRVASKAILISDNNIYGDGNLLRRKVKQVIKMLGLWNLAFFLQTRGKNYLETDVDGISYHYSVFDSYEQIKSACRSVHFVNTNIWTGAHFNLYRTAGHVAVLGIKRTNTDVF